MTETCARCGSNLALVGRSHRCVPKSSSGGLGVHQPGSSVPGKARDRVKRPAVAGSNTPEASGTARKAPGGKAVGISVPMTDPKRSTARASPNPVAKATKGKAAKAGIDVPAADRVASRLGAGRTVQDGGSAKAAPAVAIKRGRPRKPADEPVSRATRYRRQAEGKS